jgi:hypothetical protein
MYQNISEVEKIKYIFSKEILKNLNLAFLTKPPKKVHTGSVK